MKSVFIYFFILSSLLVIHSSCTQTGTKQNSSKNISDTLNTANDDFERAYKIFTAAVIHKSFSELKNVIDPSVGIFIIKSDGAIPELVSFSDIESFVAQDGKNIFSCFNEKISMASIDSTLPVIDCKYSNGTPYNKTGCFRKKVDQQIDDELGFLLSINGLPEHKDKAEVARKSLQMKVINTFNHVYYFSKNNGKWFLTFIDLRTPCNA
jgi:hypothetical protein